MGKEDRGAVSDLLRGHTDTIILRLLLDGNSYGFEIYSKILERTGEEHEIKEPTLYSSFKRLEAAGLITAYWGDETHGARRRYYKITRQGRAQFARNVAEWNATKRLMDRILSTEDENTSS